MRSQPAATIAAFRLIIALGPAAKGGKDFEHFSWPVLLRPTIINGHVNSGRRRRNRISRNVANVHCAVVVAVEKMSIF